MLRPHFTKLSHWIVLLLLPILPLSASSYLICLSPAIEYRMDDLRFNVTDKDTDFDSTFKWDNLRQIGVKGTAECVVAPGFIFGAEGGFGRIFDGRMLGSDCLGNHREFEMERSSANTTGYTVDANLSFGFGIRSKKQPGGIFLPTIGYSYHRQSAHQRDTVQSIHCLRDDEMLYSKPCWKCWDGGSSFAANWHSIWIGYDSSCAIAPRLNIHAGMKLHGLWYHGSGDSILRPNLSHFSQSGTGLGFESLIGLGYQISKNGFLGLGWQFRWFVSRDGTHRLHFNNDCTTTLNLHSVSWASIAFPLRLVVLY